MKKYALILLLSLLSITLFSQKVKVQVIKQVNSVSAPVWQILDRQYEEVFSGDGYECMDTVQVILEANKHYLFKITVPVTPVDTFRYTLNINGEPILLITPQEGTGIRILPFFTGTKTVAGKITGGTDALISDFPWQVYYISGNYLCGATIISENWVLTAAHCTEDDNGIAILPADMSLKVGATDPYVELDGKNYFVNGVYRHEGFNNQTLVNDIALLRVSEPINFPNALPIKMVSDEDVSEGFTDPGVMSWVTGWGLVNVNPNTFATVLQKVQLPIVSLAQASEIWGSIPLTDLMAGYINGNKDACNGDSGGPLVVPVFGEYKVAGIVSWGSPQCSTYGAYTRVSDFLQWIRSKTGLPVDFKPPVPVGDTMICRGTVSSTYSIDVIPTATAYHWELFPAEAGIVTENAGECIDILE